MARTFAGGTDRIAVGNNAALDLSLGTLAGWMKCNADIGPGNNPNIVSRTDSGTMNGFTIYIGDVDGFLGVQIKNGGGDVCNLAGSSNVADNAWRHVAVVFRQASGGTNRVYANGVEEANSTNSDVWTFSADDLNFGDHIHSYFPAFVGDMAEWGLWNVELDAVEIAALNKGFSPELVRPTALVDHWPFLGKNSPEPSLRSTRSGTLTGTTDGAHPRIINPIGVRTISVPAPVALAALTGTITASINEGDIVTGGKTIILTLTNDTWIPV